MPMSGRQPSNLFLLALRLRSRVSSALMRYLLCLLLLLPLTTHAVPPDIRLPNGELAVSVQDLKLKVPGGFIALDRGWTNGQWYLNPLWADLKFKLDPLDNSLKTIDRAGAEYERSGNDIFIFERRFFIKKTQTGYQWTNRLGDTIDYDAAGKIQRYADRTGTSVRFVYDAQGKKSQIRDHLDRPVFTLHYSGDELTRASDRAGREVHYRYSNGDLSEVIDVLGQSTRYAYDAKHQLTQITDPSNRVTRINYVVSLDPPVGAGGVKLGKAPPTAKDSKDTLYAGGPPQVSSNAPLSGYRVSRVGRVTDPAGHTTTYETTYDKTTRQFSTLITYPSSRKVIEVHDLEGRLLQKSHGSRVVHQLERDGPRIETTFDERGLATRVEYDELHQPVLTTHPDGTQTRRAYETRWHRLLGQVDEAGVETRYEYDALGNLTQRTEAAGRPEARLTTYTYDTLGQMLTQTVKGATPADDATTTFTYDDHGNLQSRSDPQGHTSTWSYNALGQALSHTDALGRLTRYEYDAGGRLLAVIDAKEQTRAYRYDPIGNRTKSIDALGRETTYTYDALDRLTQTTDPLNGQTTQEYDAEGRLTRRTDPSSLTTTYQYDSEGRLTQITDPAGLATRYHYGAPGSGLEGLLTAIDHPSHREEFKYDQRNRITQRSQVLDETTRLTHTSGYDAVGNLIAQTDPLNRASLQIFDARRRLTENIDALAGRTRYTYDARDNLTTVTDPTGSTTRYAYDLANRRTQETRPGGEQTQFVYDAVGNLITRRDSLGQERRYTYDEVQRRTREEHFPVIDGQLATSPNRVITYSYNALGQMTAYRDAKPLPGDAWQLLSEATYTHDALGRKTAEEVNFGPFRKTFTTAYRANGQKERLTYPDGSIANFTYDTTGRLATQQTPGGDITTTYHPSGAVSEVRLPGATQSRSHDALLRPTQIKLERGAAGSGQVLLSLAYQYDAASDILSKTTLDGATAYQYDALSRLTSVTPPESQQRSETNPIGLPVESYTYDGVHNRLSSAHQPGPWVYNANHQLLNHGEGNQAVTREYDANGHTRRIAESGGADKRLSYDVAERLTQVETESGTPIGSYAYDPFGRRLKKTTATETIYFHHGEEGLLAEYDATGNPLATYGWEPQGMWGTNPVWKKEASNTYFYANDHLGTPQVLTDASGQVVWKGRAEAFGKTTVNAASTVTNNLRFPGQYFDAETGMHYNYFRDYEPAIGRYVQSDPIGIEGGVHRYSYALQNPVTRVDLMGLLFFPLPVTPPTRWLPPGGAPGNGCGDVRSDQYVPDAYLGFDFSRPCRNHDLCYGTCGSAKADCDRKFFDDMMTVCERAPYMRVPGGEVDVVRPQCFKMAALYYWAVQNFGQQAHCAGQKEACGCTPAGCS